MATEQQHEMSGLSEKQMLAFATVVIKTLEFTSKTLRFKALFSSDLFTGLPSYREAQIQIEKLERMTNGFRAKFTIEVILSLPEDKANKIIGTETHRVNQQSKMIDRMCMKLVEEKVGESIIKQGGRLSKSFIKRKTQKFIESRNRLCYQAADEFMVRTLAAAKEHFSTLKPASAL